MNDYKRLTKRFRNSLMKPDIELMSTVQEGVFRLAELEDKIENGTLIELPCKVGDMVFTIEDDIIEEYKVLGVLMQFEELFLKILRKRDCLCHFWDSSEVFQTKAEAEAKLKELKENSYDD